VVGGDGLRGILGEFGFTKYEAAAYIALVRANPASGYEVAKVSGVPQAKIYEVLARLKAKSVVTQISRDSALYAPLDPSELVRQLRSTHAGFCDELENGLQQVKQEGGVEYIWNLLDYGSILTKARGLCDESVRALEILCWDVEYRELDSPLTAARNRGVKVFVVGHGLESVDGCCVVAHGVLPHVMKERGRQLVVVSDDRTVLLSSVQPVSTGLWTRNQGLVSLAREFIIHEAYLWRVLSRFPEVVMKEYGEHLERLRTLDGSLPTESPA